MASRVTGLTLLDGITYGRSLSGDEFALRGCGWPSLPMLLQTICRHNSYVDRRDTYVPREAELRENVNIRKLSGDVAVAFASQGVSLAVSAMTTLLVPKALGVQEFGYWQLFIFYTTYSGVCNLGLNDGVYLRLGGAKRAEADLGVLKGQMLVGLVMEVAIAIILWVLPSALGFGAQRTFAVRAAALFMVVSNLVGYLGYMFQSFGETRRFSASVLVYRIAFLAGLLPLLALGPRDFRPYCIAYFVAHVVGMLWCLRRATDLVHASFPKMRAVLSEALESVRVGSKLLVSNLASMLVLGVVRQCVDMRWGVQEFGRLSLSLTLVSFGLAFVSQVGMVLFPALRRTDDEELARIFLRLRDGLSLLLPAFYIFVGPIIWLAGVWLPAYASSLGYLVWLAPMVVFDGKMSLLGSTYLKVLRMEGVLLRLNLVAVVISAVGTAVGVWTLGSVPLAIGAGIAAICLRSIAAELIVSKKLGLQVDAPLAAGEVVIAVCFVTMCAMLPAGWSTVCYVAIYAAYLLLFRKRLAPFARFVLRARETHRG